MVIQIIGQPTTILENPIKRKQNAMRRRPTPLNGNNIMTQSEMHFERKSLHCKGSKLIPRRSCFLSRCRQCKKEGNITDFRKILRVVQRAFTVIEPVDDSRVLPSKLLDSHTSTAPRQPARPLAQHIGKGFIGKLKNKQWEGKIMVSN